MTFSNIYVGATANDGTGDALRNAMILVNYNFSLINDNYMAIGATLSIAQVEGLQTILNNIQTELNYIPGIQSDIVSINNTITNINNTLNNQNLSIIELQSDLLALETLVSSKLDDAPSDGNVYGRKDGQWDIVTTQVPNLQEVTDVANQTSNTIIINTGDYFQSYNNGGDNISRLGVNGIDISQNIGLYTASFRSDYIRFTDGTAIKNISKGSFPTNSNATYSLPSKATGNYTLATTADLSSGPTGATGPQGIQGATGSNLVKEVFIDSYIGTRIAPFSATNSGFHIEGNTNTNIGFSVVNTNTGNSALSGYGVSGTSSTGYGIGVYYASPNYFVPYLRDKNIIMSLSSDLFILASAGKDINFVTGTTYGSETNKFKISNGGTVSIGVTPSTDNTVTKGLARKSGGDIVEFTIPTGGSPSGLVKITEGGKTGYRLADADPANYVEIGVGAIDLSISTFTSTTNGAGGSYSFVAGRNNESTGYTSVVGGGDYNFATASYTTIGGGNNNYATASYATIGGGNYNQVGAEYSVIAGGNNNFVTAQYSFIGGGNYNFATAQYTFVGGGNYNQATASYATIAGGSTNEAGAQYASILGGYNNRIRGNYSGILSGYQNSIYNQYGFIGGGNYNQIYNNYSTIVGGNGNYITGEYASILGGNYNSAYATFSTVIGGNNNLAYGFGEVVGGLFSAYDATQSSTTWVATDRIFTIGNGTASDATSNAIVILKNGLATLPSVTNAIIASASGKAIVTKEYFESNSSGITFNEAQRIAFLKI